MVSLLSYACPVLAAEVHVPAGLNCDKMEPPYEEHHSQYPVERSPNAYRSMRDYRNPQWGSAPSYMVPPINSPMEILTTLVGGSTQIPHGNQDLHSLHLLLLYIMLQLLSHHNHHSYPLQLSKQY